MKKKEKMKKETKILFDHVEKMSRITNTLLCPELFHKSHNKKEREDIITTLRSKYKKVELTGSESVTINF
jgi:hypothetical protein